MQYLKIWFSFEELIEPLSDAEVGRLLRMMLKYAETGALPTAFVGNEKFVWAAAKQAIDAAEAKSEKLRQNGLKGCRPETKEKQTKANESKEKQTKANESLKVKDNVNNSFIDDDDAIAVQSEQNRVLDAAEDAGFIRSNSVRAKLIQLFADNGLEKMLAGIDSCVKHGAPNIAYLEACLRGTPKKPKPKVEAQNYGQRDYSGVQEAISNDYAGEIERRLKAKGQKKVLAQMYEQRDYSGVQDELMEQQDRDMEEFMKNEKGVS